MRILYGLCGEGMGHATRSKVSIEHLKRRGHEVLITAPDRAYDFLAPTCAPREAIQIVGLGLHCEDGALDLAGTLEKNARRLPHILSQNAKAWTLIEAFRPNAVVADFDWFGSLFALSHGLPFVSVDNHQVIPRCEHDWSLFGKDAAGLRLIEPAIRTKAPRADHYIVSSFFCAPVKAELQATTTLVPPILRAEVLRALRSPPPSGGHVLVYKTHSLDDRSILAPLAEIREQRFLLYGVKAGTPTSPNVTLRPFSESQFIRDLATSKAVVANAGMSLLGEALAFGKPMYALPVPGQYEQFMNAGYLAACGYGVWAETLDPRNLTTFLWNLDRHREAIARSSQHDGNARLYATLDRLFTPAGSHASP